VFVGSFDIPTLKPLVERFSLPSLNRLGRAATSACVRRRRRREGRRRREPKSQVGVVFSGPFVNNPRER
jgi:hypothetical protein